MPEDPDRTLQGVGGARRRQKDNPDRSKINLNDSFEVKHWTKHLNVSKEELQRAVDRVGNSAAAVKKELGHGKDNTSV